MVQKLLLISCLILAACAKSPTSLREQVASFGERRFCEEVLTFEKNASLPASLTQRFEPLQVRRYSTGVLLVYQDTEKTLSGIYVDRAKIDSVGGSGVSLEPWGNSVGWLEEKKRSSIK